MYLVLFTRTHLLGMLHKNGEGAEVGVAEGGFSEEILLHASPRRLHLIDPWVHQNREDYLLDENNASADEQERRYKAVSARFQTQVDNGQVVLHRKFSQEAAAEFPNKYFDWVYIDAMHTYDAVKEDLRAWAPKIKDEGFIMGDDFCKNPATDLEHYGVVPAVEEFVKESDFRLHILTYGGHPNYLLSRPAGETRINNLLPQVFAQFAAIEFPDYPTNFRYEQKLVSYPEGVVRVIPSFGFRQVEG